MKSGQDEGDKSGQRMREDEGAAERDCSCAAALVVEIKLDSNCLRMALMRMMLMNWCVWFGLVNLVLVNLRGWCGWMEQGSSWCVADED